MVCASGPNNCQARIIPTIETPGERMNAVYRSARESERQSRGMLAPSKGGKGMRLKAKRRTFK
jgi:hypothetical protein